MRLAVKTLNNMQTADIDELMRENPLHEEDLVKIMTVEDNKEVHNDEGDGEVQQLRTDLIREGLQFATSLVQHFLSVDHYMDGALKSQRNLQICIGVCQELFTKLQKPRKQHLITDFIKIKPITENLNNKEDF